ncbi:unnamed protein product [Effrenium voratum]|uniref:Uncharacterized protein n=1 Tax=Effrenium voratum TaxID=2562239 RepID=A0AA36JL59_9DINO|nr:unnamed protein product [Effrenium voratum]
MEVGCRFLGQGRQDSISVESYSQALQPTTAVNAGGSWSFDCAGFTEGKYDGSVTVTCGTLGSYASIQNGCTAKQCVAGAGFSASASSHQGSSTLPADIAHQGTSTMDCVNLHEALRGSFQLSCSYGELSVDTSACYVVCMTTNSGQAIFGGSVHTVTPSQEVPDGQNFSVPCVDLLAGWQGAVVAHCNGGSVNADASGCTGLPCEAGQSLSVALYDQSQEVALSQDLLHDTAETVACSSINSDYEGNFQLKCFADVLQLDKSGCSCQAQACSTAPCASTDTFSLPLTGVTSPVPIGQAVQSLEMVTLSCDSVAPGHDGSLAVFCSGAVLTPNVSTCTPRGCSSSTAAASVVVGGISSQVLATQALSHGDTFSAATCSSVNSGYSGVVNATCYLGSLVVNADGCHPSPCGVGSSVTLQLDAVSRVHSSQAETTHQGSYAAECSSLDADFYGSFQVACNYGVLTADSSTCIENPCLNTSFVQANVGGSLLTQHPPSEVVHGSVWTAACADVNWDYAGPLHMSCDKGHVGFDNSSCVLVELGCQTTGTGQSITVDNYTWVLLPGQDVAKGESFQVDCASNTEQKFVGEIRVTCGRLGNYSSVENLCVPKSCSAGVDLSVKYRGLEGTVTTSAGLAHLQTETTTCEAVDEVLRGDLRLNCQYGELIVDTSSCYMVCLPSRPATVVFAGTSHSLATPQEIVDGSGFFKACSDLASGYQGSVSVLCSAGALAADVSACEGLPCAAGTARTLTLYDASANLSLSQELASGSAESFDCAGVNPDYAGTAQLRCQAQALRLDSSGCSCQADACSSAPCQSSDSFLVELSGVQAAVAVGEVVPSLTTVTRSCNSAVAGHDGDMTVLCSGGVLHPDTSGCSPRGCSSATAGKQVVVGGTVAQISSQTLAHGEHFVAQTCASVDPGYQGVINGSCYLGSLVLSDSCEPKPCEDTIKYVTHAGLSLLARLNGVALGSSSPAPSGFQGTGACSLFDDRLIGTFSVSCLAAAYSLDLGSCYLNTCDVPSAAFARLGTSAQAISLQAGLAAGGTESFDCADASPDYSGQGQLVCVDQKLYASTSSCSCSGTCVQSCSGRFPAQLQELWTVYHSALAEGQTEALPCQNFSGFTGDAVASCTQGVWSVDTSSCLPENCTAGSSTEIQVGSRFFQVQANVEVRSGASWTLPCADFDTEYEGTVTASCARGAFSASASCKELSCGTESRQLVFNGSGIHVELSPSTLGLASTSTPSNFSASVACTALAPALDGTASVVCYKGVYTLDSACTARGCGGGSMKTPMGSREITVTVDQSLPHGGNTSRSCASIMGGWTGTFYTECNFTELVPDSAGCAPGICTAGQVATVVVGTTISSTAIASDMQSFEAMSKNCSEFDGGYEGALSISCEATVLFTDATSCSPVVQQGQVAQAVKVVESAVAFALPVIQGASQAELQAAMDTPSTKRAYALTLAASLGVQNVEDVIVLAIQVLEAVAAGRRLSDSARRLAGNFEVNVNFQLRTNSDQEFAFQKRSRTSAAPTLLSSRPLQPHWVLTWRPPLRRILERPPCSQRRPRL